MKTIRFIAALSLTAFVSACGTAEIATRNAPLDAAPIQPITASLNVQEVVVEVPRKLKVSEANLYYPSGDIVWREDPLGDRHAQVKAIFEEGLGRGVAGLPTGSVPVRLKIEVNRFHALTEKARYTVGGWHSVQFTMTLEDPATGVALTAPRLIKADFKAFGGARAINAERNGITQKVRITQRIASVIQQELMTPEAQVLAETVPSDQPDQL